MKFIFYIYIFLLFVKFILLSENEITIIMIDNSFQHPNYKYFHPYHSKFTCQNLRCYLINTNLYEWSIPMNHSYLKYTTDLEKYLPKSLKFGRCADYNAISCVVTFPIYILFY